MRDRRISLKRWIDAAILAAFFGLSIAAYDRLFAGVSDLLAAPIGMEFTDFYLPGHNPWTGTAPEPAPTETRFASLWRLHRAYH